LYGSEVPWQLQQLQLYTGTSDVTLPASCLDPHYQQPMFSPWMTAACHSRPSPSPSCMHFLRFS